MTTEAEVLRVDTRGRVRVSAERREALLDEFERSGLSGVKFAQLVGVKYPTFALWVQKRKKQRAGSVQAVASAEQERRPVRLLEAFAGVAEPAEEALAGLELSLPGGVTLRVRRPAEVALAAELLRLLARAGTRPC